MWFVMSETTLCYIVFSRLCPSWFSVFVSYFPSLPVSENATFLMFARFPIKRPCAKLLGQYYKVFRGEIEESIGQRTAY